MGLTSFKHYCFQTKTDSFPCLLLSYWLILTRIATVSYLYLIAIDNEGRVQYTTPGWLPRLDGCAQQVCQIFEVVWLRLATRTLHDELPGGIVHCSPTGCNSGVSRIKGRHNKTSIEWRCYLFLSVVTGTSRWSAMHIVGKQCQILEWKRDLLIQS